MTIANYRLKLTRVNNLKLRVSTRIPAQFENGAGVSVTKTSGTYTVDLDYDELGTIVTYADALEATTYLASWESIGDTFSKISIADFKADLTASFDLQYQPLDADLTAIAALAGTGIARRTASDTWTLGTTVSVAEGGTGAVTHTVHGVLLGQGTSAITTLNGTVGNSSLPLISQGSALDPIYSQIAFAAISGWGTGVTTALAVNVGSAGAFVVNGGALGTPSSGTATNLTGLPIASGVSGLGTGIATALAVNTGSAGAPVLFNGALGTPTSGTLTNATGLPTAGLVNNAVTNAKMATMAQSTIKGRAAGAGTGDPTDLSATQATAILNAFVGDSGAGGTKGLVPAPATGDATKFLRGDGVFESIPGGGDMLAANNLSDVANATTARLNLQAPCFSAHKNATNQTGIPANNASTVKITFTTEAFDHGSYYDTANSRWTPPAGRVRLTVSAYLSAGAVDQAQSLIAVFKGGSLYKYVAISNASGTAGTVLNGSCIDEANGTDYYEAFISKGGAGDGTLSGNTAYTWFQGEIL